MPLIRPQFIQKQNRSLSACRCILLSMFFSLGSLVSAAQEVIIAGSERTESPKKNPVPPKPVVVKPRQEVYIDMGIVSDDDCILTIDGVRQKDTLRAGKTTMKKLTSGIHRLSAESIASGFVFNQQVKTDATGRLLVEVPVKAYFERHMRRVETALLQQE